MAGCACCALALISCGALGLHVAVEAFRAWPEGRLGLQNNVCLSRIGSALDVTIAGPSGKLALRPAGTYAREPLQTLGLHILEPPETPVGGARRWAALGEMSLRSLKMNVGVSAERFGSLCRRWLARVQSTPSCSFSPSNGTTSKMNGALEHADQPDPDAIKMFVGQIPRSWSEKELKELFEPYGAVYQINILRDRTQNPPQSKGNSKHWTGLGPLSHLESRALCLATPWMLFCNILYKKSCSGGPECTAQHKDLIWDTENLVNLCSAAPDCAPPFCHIDTFTVQRLHSKRRPAMV
ncbi:hypothetical protein Z043_114817 [Scleropages formosus]|uniref:RRM domain-containing protein n=1 Tax=Scleropages formosus TaxID=113540 RepID=A0A0P7TYR3_SCLFO|nr:hypothetical protein Z043_114817 [Scleropages formosus]